MRLRVVWIDMNTFTSHDLVALGSKFDQMELNTGERAALYAVIESSVAAEVSGFEIGRATPYLDSAKLSFGSILSRFPVPKFTAPGDVAG